MNKYLTLIFVLCCNILSAQKAKYSVYGGINYGILNAKDTNSEEFSFFQSSPQIFTVTKQKLTWSYSSDIEPGFKLGLNIHFPLKNNINFRTGIEGQYISFRLNSQISKTEDDDDFGSLLTDDVTEFLLFNKELEDVNKEEFCNDNLSSLPSFKFPITQYLTYLKIPLGIEFIIFEGDFSIYSGLFFSSLVKREIGLNCDTASFTFGGGLNRSSDFVKTNHSTKINSSNFGGDCGFSYQIVEKIAIEGSFSTTFNSIFKSNKESANYITGEGIPATLQVASFGARFSLN